MVSFYKCFCDFIIINKKIGVVIINIIRGFVSNNIICGFVIINILWFKSGLRSYADEVISLFVTKDNNVLTATDFC